MSKKKQGNQRGKGSATWVIGLLLTVGGASTVAITLGLNISSSLKMNDLIKNGGDSSEYIYSDTGSYQIEPEDDSLTFKVDDTSDKADDTSDNTGTSSKSDKKKSKKKDKIQSIEVLDQDMKINPVSEYKNVIKIDSLDIVTPITEGTGKNMQYSVGHFEGTQGFGEKGNACFAGHASTIYQCIFNNLEQIQLGAIINTYNADGTQVDYVVTDTNIIDPYDWSLVNRKPKKAKMLTLVTCTDKGHSRFVVTAKVMSKKKYLKYMKTLKADRLDAITEGIRTVHDQLYSITDLLTLSELNTSRFYVPKTLVIENLDDFDKYTNTIDSMYELNYFKVAKNLREAVKLYGVYNREEFTKGVPVGYFAASVS